MDLKITTVRKPARIHFSDNSVIAGSFFIVPTAHETPGTDSIYDLLNSERAYLPFEASEDGTIFLVKKDSVVTVLIQEPEIQRDEALFTPAFARIYLLTGETMEGHVYIDLPKAYSRLSDFVNFSKPFFHIDVGGKEYLINSRYIKMLNAE